MIVLGTFVDSLAMLLVFAPVAIEISKTLRHRSVPDGPGDGDVQPDRRRVAADRAAAVRHHQHRAGHLREINRHVWWFMLAETLVLLLVIFIPGLASWIPHYFLG